MVAAAMGAEDAEGSELADRARRVAVDGGVDDGEARRDRALPDRRQPVECDGVASVDVDPGDGLGLAGEDADGGVRVARVDRVRELLDRPPKRWTVRSTTMPSPTAEVAGSPSTAEPVARARESRVVALIWGRSAAGPTMSPSTAPASIEVSWPGSPTRISLASRRTASVRRAIRESETIEVSSTITTS